MFRFSRILSLGLICIVWACVQKPAVTTSPEPSSQADALFQRAEEKYAAEAYEEGLRQGVGLWRCARRDQR